MWLCLSQNQDSTGVFTYTRIESSCPDMGIVFNQIHIIRDLRWLIQSWDFTYLHWDSRRLAPNYRLTLAVFNLSLNAICRCAERILSNWKGLYDASLSRCQTANLVELRTVGKAPKRDFWVLYISLLLGHAMEGRVGVEPPTLLLHVPMNSHDFECQYLMNGNQEN